MSIAYTDKGATISRCGKYRYNLWREWDKPEPTDPWCMFCGLNPSTADGSKDDATIRREVGFARRWGFKRYFKVNVYALRSTDPKGLWATLEHPSGPDNWTYVRNAAINSHRFVAAWGDSVQLQGEHEVKSLLREHGITVYALRITKKGHPQHPLRLAASTEPFVWLAGKPLESCA